MTWPTKSGASFSQPQTADHVHHFLHLNRWISQRAAAASFLYGIWITYPKHQSVISRRMLFVYIYTYIYIHFVYIHIYISIYIMYVYLFIYLYIYMFIWIYIYSMYIFKQFMTSETLQMLVSLRCNRTRPFGQTFWYGLTLTIHGPSIGWWQHV